MFIYIVYELNLYNSKSNYATLENWLFWAGKLTRGNDIDNYKFFGYGIQFHKKEFFLIGNVVSGNVWNVEMLKCRKNIEFKAKKFEIDAIPLCLGSITKVFSEDNTKKTELNGYVYDFSVNIMLLQLLIF